MVPGVSRRLGIKAWTQGFAAARVICPAGRNEGGDRGCARRYEGGCGCTGRPSCRVSSCAGIDEKEAVC